LKITKIKKNWEDLTQHASKIKKLHMRDMFRQDPARFEKFSVELDGLLFDYSRNIIDEKAISILCDIAESCNLTKARTALFSGEKINSTENRAALHTACRQKTDDPIILDGTNVLPEIRETLAKMRKFCEDVHSGKICGSQGDPFTDVVHIGIGGSSLGPQMACEALSKFHSSDIQIHFVTNLDTSNIDSVLETLDAKKTLFLIASKTFTTQETMANTSLAKKWLLSNLPDSEMIKKHFIAITCNYENAQKNGISKENIFKSWDWIGGRYSIWSVFGLPVALFVGMNNFEKMLKGAYAMDQHFLNAKFSENIPVLSAVLGVWYIKYFKAQTHAVLPYNYLLRLLPKYLQQLDMESNGKSVCKDGKKNTEQTAPIIWGDSGIEAQHAFYQLIHQSNHLIPIDFLISVEADGRPDHHRLLVSHCFAQTQALTQGTGPTGSSEPTYKQLEGNKPSNTFFFQTLDPYHLGLILALYEHKIFTQGVIWDVNSFDQWGVELGKELVAGIEAELDQETSEAKSDFSTKGLIDYYRKHR